MNNENNNLNQNINNVQTNASYQQTNIQAQNGNNLPLRTRKINKFAIYSIISSSVSLIIFWWLASAGIGYGIKSLKDTKVNGEKGKVLAILGIIIGIISISLYFISRAGLLN